MEPFQAEKPIIGMVHMLPTPNSPKNMGRWGINEIIDKAVEDTRILQENGCDGVIVENYNDAPFFPEEIPPHSFAVMSMVVHEVLKEATLPVGVNILRNACKQAIGLAGMTGASFIRCNVLTGTMITNQGMLYGKAHELIRYRDILGKGTKIFADVVVKHAHSIVPLKRFEDMALDTLERGRADAVIVTGKRTGIPPSESLLAMVHSLKKEREGTKVLVGSGGSPQNVVYLDRYFDGFIMGSYFEEYNPEKGWYDVLPSKIKHVKKALEKGI